jgi:hypothetical protein
MTEAQHPEWQTFIEGPIYPVGHAPWGDDPAFAFITAHPGLRDSIGGHVAAAIQLTLHMVRTLARVDLLQVVQAQRPARGLCLGFGMHALEPYDLLHTFHLDQVHAYEWIAEHVVEAACTLQALQRHEPDLPARLRLHHSSLADLRALADGSIRIVYVANVFNSEIPMTAATFSRAVQEMLRVLADGSIVLSRSSTGRLESALAPHGCMLVQTPFVAVFQKGVAL